MTFPIQFEQRDLEDFCLRNRIIRLSFFGSVLRQDFGPHSDVDVLVEFEASALITFLDMARMEEELSRLFGRQVDMRTPQELSRYFRQQVLAEAEVHYAA